MASFFEIYYLTIFFIRKFYTPKVIPTSTLNENMEEEEEEEEVDELSRTAPPNIPINLWKERIHIYNNGNLLRDKSSDLIQKGYSPDDVENLYDYLENHGDRGLRVLRPRPNASWILNSINNFFFGFPGGSSSLNVLINFLKFSVLYLLIFEIMFGKINEYSAIYVIITLLLRNYYVII